jgi:hypothetical protein
MSERKRPWFTEYHSELDEMWHNIGGGHTTAEAALKRGKYWRKHRAWNPNTGKKVYDSESKKETAKE